MDVVCSVKYDSQTKNQFHSKVYKDYTHKFFPLILSSYFIVSRNFLININSLSQILLFLMKKDLVSQKFPVKNLFGSKL